MTDARVHDPVQDEWAMSAPLVARVPVWPCAGGMVLRSAYEDVERLARHFRVSPDWPAVEVTPSNTEANAPEGLTLRPPFEVVSTGETGHEIRDADGVVFGWTGDRAKAMVVAGLLEAAARG
jgi:hypothetical protein